MSLKIFFFLVSSVLVVSGQLRVASLIPQNGDTIFFKMSNDGFLRSTSNTGMDCNGDGSQDSFASQWIIISDSSNSYYYIQNVDNSQYLQLKGSNSNQFGLTNSKGDDKTKWQIVNYGSTGKYMLQNYKFSSYYVSNSGNSASVSTSGLSRSITIYYLGRESFDVVTPYFFGDEVNGDIILMQSEETLQTIRLNPLTIGTDSITTDPYGGSGRHSRWEITQIDVPPFDTHYMFRTIYFDDDLNEIELFLQIDDDGNTINVDGDGDTDNCRFTEHRVEDVDHDNRYQLQSVAFPNHYIGVLNNEVTVINLTISTDAMELRTYLRLWNEPPNDN